MDPSREEILKEFNRCEPLSEAETIELSKALYELSRNGVAVPRQLLRYAREADGGIRHYGSTLDALPRALDLLGPDREAIVIGLLQRFEQAVRDHHDQVKNRKPGTDLDQRILARYFDVAFFLRSAKPKTEESALHIADFLRSEKDEVHSHASEMLEGAPYSPVIIDRLFENVSKHGIRQWPNRQARALASFADLPEVRSRIMDCIRGDNENLRHLAILTFAFLKERAGPDAEEELFSIAENDGDELQSPALTALRVIAGSNPRLRGVALRLIRSNKFWVRGHAIASLGGFSDPEVIDALIHTLQDEGGHDFDNAGNAAKLLQTIPLDADHVLAPLTDTLQSMLNREDKFFEMQQSDYKSFNRKVAKSFRAAYEGRLEDPSSIVRFADSESLLAVAQVISCLGEAAQAARPLLEKCMKRPYVSGAGDGEKWSDLLEKITKH